MFQDLYAVARHTPLSLTITPQQGERLQVIVIPMPTGAAAGNAALARPLKFVGTPAELDAEVPGALARYAGPMNVLRLALDLPLDAIEEATKKAAKKDAAKAETTKKKEAESQARSEAAKKAARTRAAQAEEQKKARQTKAAERKRAREAALKKRRDAAAARKAKRARPASKITLPGATSAPKIKAAPQAQATPGTMTRGSKESPNRVQGEPAVAAPARHLASKPGKAECIADWRQLNAKEGANLTRRKFIKLASTSRRYEKLWKNWEEFIDEAREEVIVKPDSGAAQGQSAADVPPPSSPTVAEPAAPEPAVERYEIRDDATNKLICLVDKRPQLGDWVEVPPFVAGKFNRARVIGVEAFGRYFKVLREASTEGADAT